MRTFKSFLEAVGARPLYQELMLLRPKMAQAAQEVYNAWEQDKDGIDEFLGGGGICDQISQAIGDVIVSSIHDANVTEGGTPGDDHAWTIVYNQTEAYGVDIACHTYERGGGYNWTKIPNVRFTPNDVSIFEVPHGNFEREW